MLTEAIENLFNRNLGQSPRARELCRELLGKPLRVEIRGTPWPATPLQITPLNIAPLINIAPLNITIESLGHSLRITRAATDITPAAIVSGSPVNLLALAGGDPQAVIRRGAVLIEGDAEVAQSYQQLLQFLRPEVEEELSKLVGDSPAHEVMRFANLALSFGKRAVDTGVRNTAEYLAHESGDLVPRAEAEQFLEGVGVLREDVDRLEARIAVLAARRSGGAA